MRIVVEVLEKGEGVGVGAALTSHIYIYMVQSGEHFSINPKTKFGEESFQRTYE